MINYIKDDSIYEEKVDIKKGAKSLGRKFNNLSFEQKLALAATGTVAGVIAHKKIKKVRTDRGYKKDPELKDLKLEAERVEREIKKTSRQIYILGNDLNDEIEIYNEMASAMSAPTISLSSSSALSAGTLEDYLEVEDLFASKKKCKDELNIHFNPGEYEKCRKKIRSMKRILKKYAEMYEKLDSLKLELRSIKRQMDKNARKRNATPEIKAGYRSRTKDIENEHQSIRSSIDEKEIYGESCYEEIYDELCYRIECGDLTLEEAEIINKRAYDSFFSE